MKSKNKECYFKECYSQQIANLTPGLFSLVARTDDYYKSVPLYFNAHRALLLIQVSKPVFKPYDIVEFRIFAVNSRTRPYKIKKSSRIWVVDPGNNQVKVWENPFFLQGLFEGELKLNNAEPGEWKVLVEADGEVRNYSLTVSLDFTSSLTDRIEVVRGSRRQNCFAGSFSHNSEPLCFL